MNFPMNKPLLLAAAVVAVLAVASPADAFRHLSSDRLTAEQCAKAGTAMDQGDLLGKLLPCVFNLQSDACCNALTDLFGPDTDVEADLEYCLCNEDYLGEMEAGLADVPFVTAEKVLNALQFCKVPHARPDGSFPGCE